jgi:hypothetical protein
VPTVRRKTVKLLDMSNGTIDFICWRDAKFVHSLSKLFDSNSDMLHHYEVALKERAENPERYLTEHEQRLFSSAPKSKATKGKLCHLRAPSARKV